ncbi:MAG: sulfate/molybdate ABC transporter ATP-binding protein [Chloroflexota bacterium]
MSIEVQNVTKRFGTFTAVNDVSLQVPSGELVAILGPSGSGKTSLLRIIAGLDAADSGSVFFHGEDTTDRHVRERQVGFVFQHYALFRHMTVFDNVAFGLTVRPRAVRPSKQEIRERVHKLLDLVQLDWLADRYPAQLSGGQRQRIALARALAIEPKVLLLDEPFGALDAKVRQELRRWLRRLHDDLHITGLLVTHDQDEALEVADRVVVMNEGRVVQVGTPDEVYDHPATPFVFHFLGNVNLFHGRLEEGRLSFGQIQMDAPQHTGLLAAPAVGYVRPHDLEISHTAESDDAAAALVRHIRGAGPVVRLELERVDTGELIEAELSREAFRMLAIELDQQVYVKPRSLRVWIDPDGTVKEQRSAHTPEPDGWTVKVP